MLYLDKFSTPSLFRHAPPASLELNSPSQGGIHYISQAALEHTNFLPWPPEWWDYRYAPPHQFLPSYYFTVSVQSGGIQTTAEVWLNIG